MKKIVSVVILLLACLPMFSNTWYISNTGNDSYNGSVIHPFRTIQKGADMAQPGDTVFVLGGVYRERVAPPRGGTAGNPIVYFGEPGAHVFIKGSDVWEPVWQKHAAYVYYAVPNENMFTDDFYYDDKNPFKVAVASTPYGRDGKPEYDRGYGGDPNIIYNLGQVFVGGKMFIQKPYLHEMEAETKTWYYDRSTGRLYIHFASDDPNAETTEITTRRRIFAPHRRQLGYITVEGFIMEHCGNQYPTNFWTDQKEWQQAGALGLRCGNHWVIRNNMIRFANTTGIDCGIEGITYDIERGSNGGTWGAGNNVIENNYICDNGGGGLIGFQPGSVTVKNNVFERNNNLLFSGQARWEHGAIKFHSAANSVISHNLVRNNPGGWGIWLDGGAGPNTFVHANVVVNSGAGFDLEIGANPVANQTILDNNVFINNNKGVSSRESGGLTSIHNLVIGSIEYGQHVSAWVDRPDNWTSEHHYVYNNLFMDNPIHISLTPEDYFRSDDRRLDFNMYSASSTQQRFEIYGHGSFKFADWKSQWQLMNGLVDSDAHSVIRTGSTWSYDSENLTLSVTLDRDPKAVGTQGHSALTTDFMGNNIPSNGTAVPGPFQSLVMGENHFKLWNGIRPLVEYELPDLSVIRSYARINNDDWQQTNHVMVCTGETVAFGPQPIQDSRWKWSGPGGFTSTLREISIINVLPYQAGEYIATYTDDDGQKHSHSFFIQLEIYPTATVSVTDESCEDQNGMITLTFPDTPDRTNIAFSIDGGVTYPANVNENIGTYEFASLLPGEYHVWTRWGNQECPVDLGSYTVNADPLPSATVTPSPSSDLANGSITFTFGDIPGRTNIAFSIDGGFTFPVNVNENTGTYEYSGLAPGVYSTWTRWGNQECPVFLGDYEVETITSLQKANWREQVMLFPNPAGDLLHVSTARMDMNDFKITDLQGRVVLASNGMSTNGITSIDIANLQPGIYFLCVGDNVAKFVKAPYSSTQ